MCSPRFPALRGVDIGESLGLVVEGDLDDVQRRVPGVDLAPAVFEKICE